MGNLDREVSSNIPPIATARLRPFVNRMYLVKICDHLTRGPDNGQKFPDNVFP